MNAKWRKDLALVGAEGMKVVEAAAKCAARGEVEALLRREKLYSSHLCAPRSAEHA